MGIEPFDPAVVERNNLTCTPDILMRAVQHINNAGAGRGPGGLPKLLPGLTLNPYGLPGESHGTHVANLLGLNRILDAGLLCHRTNVRLARAFPGNATRRTRAQAPLPSAEHFASWKADIDFGWDQPMKERVYPTGLRVPGLHSYFVGQGGTWWRRLGSYSIQIIERDTATPVWNHRRTHRHRPRPPDDLRRAPCRSSLTTRWTGSPTLTQPASGRSESGCCCPGRTSQSRRNCRASA